LLSREFLEKIAKIKYRANEKAADVRNDFAKIHKPRAEALKKTEEMVQNSEKNLSKIEREIIKSKDLVAESRPRLNDEIKKTKEEIAEKYTDLKDEVSRAISSR
jgi:recombinational DNA repair ATPase RecF